MKVGFNTDPTAEKVFCRHGSKNPVTIIGGSGKEYYTVLECCNAMGNFITPYVLFKAKNLYNEWCVETVDGWRNMDVPFCNKC